MPDGSSTASVAISDLRVVRGGTLVLDSISLELPRAQVTGLLGPSGSGKTTLIRCLAGVQIVEAGTVTIEGHPAGHPDLRQRIGYMTQHASVYADLTVAENVAFWCGVQDVPSARGQAIVETVGLADCRDVLTARLSGGQRSRVSLACALVGSPELLLLDEPTVGLDPRLRRDLWAEFHRLAEAGATVLVSTHVMDEADRCDSLVLMREGAVVATGSPAELLERAGAAAMEDAFLTLAEDGR